MLSDQEKRDFITFFSWQQLTNTTPFAPIPTIFGLSMDKIERKKWLSNPDNINHLISERLEKHSSEDGKYILRIGPTTDNRFLVLSEKRIKIMLKYVKCNLHQGELRKDPNDSEKIYFVFPRIYFFFGNEKILNLIASLKKNGFEESQDFKFDKGKIEFCDSILEYFGIDKVTLNFKYEYAKFPSLFKLCINSLCQLMFNNPEKIKEAVECLPNDIKEKIPYPP